MGRHSQSEGEEEEIGDDEYYPSRILAEVRRDGKPMYLIEWEDWPLGAATEEPRSNFVGNTGLIEQWQREKRRIRLGKSKTYDLQQWRQDADAWERLPPSKQSEVCAKMQRDREAAEAIGNFGDASSSVGSSDEADEGPIEISDDSAGASKKRPSKYKNNRPVLEDSEDEESDDDELVVAPNGAKLQLGRPTKQKKTPRDNIGVTGYQGNANRAPLPPRTLPAEGRQQRPKGKLDPNNKARREGARPKVSQKMEDKIRAAAAGQEVNNGSKKPFRNMSMAHRANKIGNTLHERTQVMPATLRSLGAGGKTVSFGPPATAASSSTTKAGQAPAPTAPAQAQAADKRRDSIVSSDDDAWNVDDEDITERTSTNFSTAAWPRMPQPEKPTEKEVLKKREEALKKQIEDSKSALENAIPIFNNAGIKAAVFNVRKSSSAGSPTSAELLPAPTSRGIIPPSNTLGAIADGNTVTSAGQSRPRVHAHRPKTDPLFVQTTKERIANQDRMPRPASLRPEHSTVNNIPQGLPSPMTNTRPVARTSVSFHDYQASRRASGPANAPLDPPTSYRAISESGATVNKIVSEEMVGCRYEDLLPHLANLGRESDPAYYYLLFPSSATPLADTITKWLRKSSGFAKVFHCQQLGSWTRFVELTQSNAKKLNGGCLIVHSSLRRMIPKQPQMITFLLNGNNTIWCADESAPNGRLLNIVFKAGGTILITPRLFETEPQKAARILNWFLNHKLPHTRGKIWKIALLRHMTTYLNDLWHRKTKEREELIQQYRQIGESDDNMEKTAEARGLSKTNMEMMIMNLRLVQKIKHHGLPIYPLPGTKEAETAFVELSGAIGYEDEVAIVEGFAMQALMHWEPTRKWIVVGTGEPAHKAQEKKEPQAITNGNAKQVEQQGNGVSSSNGSTTTTTTTTTNEAGGQFPQALAETLAAKQKGLTIPVTTADNIDRNVFMVNTGVPVEIADHYLETALGDISLALRHREIDIRDGALPEDTMDYSGKPAAPEPYQNGDVAMDDASQESGEVMEISPPVNGAPPPTPPEMAGSPSKQLQAEISANEVAMEDAVSMVPDNAPPPPPEDALPPAQAKIKFSMPSPNATKKSPPGPQGQSTSEAAAAQAPGSTAENAMDIDIDMTAPGLVQDKSRLETRPTVEWYKEREMENTDWKHILVLGYTKSLKFFNIAPEWDPTSKKKEQPQQQKPQQQK